MSAARVQVEAALLGTAILGPRGLAALGGVPEADLCHPCAGAAKRALASLEAAGGIGRGAVDLVSLSTHLGADRERVLPWLRDAVLSVPGPENGPHYARLVRLYARRERLAAACRAYAASAVEGNLGPEDEGEHALLARLVQELGAEAGGDVWTGLDLASATRDRYERARAGEMDLGLQTGLPSLDAIIGGLKPSTLSIIAARPGCGKSALALQVALARAGEVGVLFWSLEMNRSELGLRASSILGGVPGWDIERGRMSDGQALSVSRAWSNLGEMRLALVTTGGLSVAQLRSRTRAMTLRDPVGLVIVDYLQLMRADGRHQNRETAVAEISRGLKALAMELEIPVIALSQLNRQAENRPDRRPRLADLRESGAIEQDADLVLGIYREGLGDQDADQHAAELIVLKNRGGRTGTVRLRWDGPTTTFSEG